MKQGKHPLGVRRKRLFLSNAGCPRCKAITPIRITRAGRTIGETEGWIEVVCIRCETPQRLVPIHPDEEERGRKEAT